MSIFSTSVLCQSRYADLPISKLNSWQIFCKGVQVFLLLSIAESVIAQTSAKPVTPTTPSKEVAATVATKKPISHDVYALWRSIQGSTLSRDGSWLAYALLGQESDGELVVKNLRSGQEWRSPRGIKPMFSADARFLAFAIAPTQVELDRAKKDKKKADDFPKPSLGVMDLTSGKVENLERVKRFSFAEEAGNFLAVQFEANKDKDKDKVKSANEEVKADEATFDLNEEDQEAASGGATKKKEEASTLLIWDLIQNQKTTVKDVTDFSWNKQGTRLAYHVWLKDQPKTDTVKAVTETPLVSTPSNADGVYVFNTVSGKAENIFSGSGSVKQMRFDEAGQQFAFLTNRDELIEQKKRKEAAKNSDKAEAKTDGKMNAELVLDATKEKPNATAKEPEAKIFKLYFWREGIAQANILVDSETLGMPKSWGPSEFAELSFSKDGQRLFLGTAELAKAEVKNAAEPMKVDLWHWKDPELQAMQKVNADKEKQRNYRAVVHLSEAKFIQLANKNIPQVVINEDANMVMGLSTLPYRNLMSWDSLYYDAYAINIQNGQAKMLIEKSRFQPHFSPSGKYLVNFDAQSRAWFAYDTQTGARRNLTGATKIEFDDRHRDTPEPKDAYGIAGWTENDASILLYDQFDLWEASLLNPAAKLRNVTQAFGRKNKLQLRYVHLGEESRSPDKKALPKDSAWLLSASNEENYGTGYFRIDPVNTSDALPTRLIYLDKMLGNVQKAKAAETLIFTQQSFTEFPDLWVSTTAFNAPQKISDANPQQSQYNWGSQELIYYTTADGKKLKALLTKPDNFDPKKKYPMMVYIYEKMSDNLHRYVAPSPSQNINVTRFVSNGYLVLRPDIEYKTGYPGQSAMKTVLPAIKEVISKSYVDAKRIAIQGHSWGAYQVNYLITHTNMFRAVEAGASMANMVSGYGGIRWGTGMSRAFQYEKQQSRIGGTPWDSTDKYIENSPIFAVDKVKTPYLTVHNDDDDAVPWYQAIEFFTALRRLNKEAYWFNYNGEKHGLKERDHIKHFTVHMCEFFDHYLLDKPRPEWMDKPIPYLERGQRDVMGLFKVPVTAPVAAPVAQ